MCSVQSTGDLIKNRPILLFVLLLILALFSFFFFSLPQTACLSSRPGQVGRADGYILEGKELEFYLRKIKAKKGK